jgi:hypothetical protein
MDNKPDMAGLRDFIGSLVLDLFAARGAAQGAAQSGIELQIRDSKIAALTAEIDKLRGVNDTSRA